MVPPERPLSGGQMIYSRQEKEIEDFIPPGFAYIIGG